MANIPLDQPFVLRSQVNPKMAIQAATAGGGGLSLQPYDVSNPSQQFILRMQNNLVQGKLSASGPAFINLGSRTGSLVNSVTSGGNKKPLNMQSWTPSSQDEDAWSLSPIAGGGVRICLSSETQWSWNDWGGGGNQNDPIYLNNDSAPNSAWSVVLLAPAQVNVNEQPFSLQSILPAKLAIQAASGPGQGLTLQAYQSSNLAQQFVLRMQNNINAQGSGNSSGVSFVSLGSTAAAGVYNSVLAQSAAKNPLLMEPYVPSSLAIDAMCPSYISGQGLRMLLSVASQWSWNDWGGNGTPKDPIYLNDDAGSNSIWSVVLVG